MTRSRIAARGFRVAGTLQRGRRVALATSMAVAAGCASIHEHAQDMNPAHEIVNQSVMTLSAFDPKDFPSLAPALQEACAVLIFPRVGTAAFLVGGAYGQGVLMEHDRASGRWHGPVFMALSEVGVGVHVAGGPRELVVVLRSCAALDEMLREDSASVRLRAALAAQADERGSARQFGKDVQVFSLMRGIDLGGALNWTVLHMDSALGRAFYGASLSPDDVFATDPTGDPIAVEMRLALAYAAKQ